MSRCMIEWELCDSVCWVAASELEPQISDGHVREFLMRGDVLRRL